MATMIEDINVAYQVLRTAKYNLEEAKAQKQAAQETINSINEALPTLRAASQAARDALIAAINDFTP